MHAVYHRCTKRVQNKKEAHDSEFKRLDHWNDYRGIQKITSTFIINSDLLKKNFHRRTQQINSKKVPWLLEIPAQEQVEMW